MVTLTKALPEQYLITETPAELARQAVAKFRDKTEPVLYQR